eukprot:2832_1
MSPLSLFLLLISFEMVISLHDNMKNCSYISMCGNSCHYFPMDVCWGSNDGEGQEISYIYECSDDNSYVMQKEYNTSYNCEGIFAVVAVFNNTKYTPFNCNGIDCSSKVRIYYETCDITNDSIFYDEIQITSVCEYDTPLPDQSSYIQCNDTEVVEYSWNYDYNALCNFSVTPNEIEIQSNGCHKVNGQQQYYDVVSCNFHRIPKTTKLKQ